MQVLAEAEDLGVPTSYWSLVEHLSAQGWAAAAGSDVALASQFLEEAAAVGERVGDRLEAVRALHDIARLGGAQKVATRLGDLTRGMEGQLAAVMAAHARALVDKDAPGLEACSASFETLGACLLAAEAAADAAAAWMHRGGARSAAAAGRRAGRLADGCEGAVTPALGAIESRVRLTPAERECALLAAAGRSNREIAGTLYLSVRTVENRLQRIYEKLGVTSRADLAMALER
jgi:DNA-binding CsgD family transcriptional regulator